MAYRHSDLVPLYALTIITLAVCIGTLSLARGYPKNKITISAPAVVDED